MYGYTQNYNQYGYQPNYYTDQLSQLRGQPMQQPAPQTQTNNGLIWVQGETGAKSYLVAPNTTIMLMDSESSRFYLKSADASGMPMPLRTFEYKEIVQGVTPPNLTNNTSEFDLNKFVTRDELNEILANLTAQETSKRKKKDEADNG